MIKSDEGEGEGEGEAGARFTYLKGRCDGGEAAEAPIMM